MIAVAQAMDAVLLSVDLDFASVLDYPPQKYGGIIVLRHRTLDEDALDITLHQLLDDRYRDDLRQTLAIVDAGRYRIRR